MRCPVPLRLSLGLALAAVSVVAALPSTVPSAPPGLVPTDVPGIDLPIVQEHRYLMRGHVRAFPPFWIGRDDVGEGVIRWRAQGHRQGYELIIGTDPARAPRQLNRWGYLAEETKGNEGTVVGLIAKSGEDRLEDVESDARRADPRRPFSSIRARVTDGSAYSIYSTIYIAPDLTYRDVGAVVASALSETAATPPEVFDRPSGTRPGFLTSVAELVHGSVQAQARGVPVPTADIPYIYGDDVYVVRQVEATPIERFEHRGRQFEHVVRGRFETGRQRSRQRTKFELVYGAHGDLAGVPVLIAYQPRWWLKVELLIESRGSTVSLADATQVERTR